MLNNEVSFYFLSVLVEENCGRVLPKVLFYENFKHFERHQTFCTFAELATQMNTL